jgi:hypothetical protein
MLPVNETPAQKAQPAHAPAHSIDGFVRPKSHAPRRVVSTSVPHHPVEKSSTLMRKTVKKPASITPLTGRHTKQASTVVPNSPKPVHNEHTLPAERLNRAEQVKRSSLIQRFGSEMQSVVTSAQHSAAAVMHAPVVSISQPISEPEEANVSDIEAATSHHQPKIKKTPVHHRIARKLRVKPRTLSVSAAVMAFVVLGGFFAISNAPNLSMRVAAMKSQVHGTLPGYKPSGFAINGPIKYQPGEIIVSYKSNSDSRNFQITQKASAWDTESLRQNYVDTLKTTYQTVQDKGKTIYLYDDASATWVDGGVWYKIDGNSQLNTDQVLKLAASL